MSIETKLMDLGIRLPEAAAPVASYVPTVQAGNLLYVSGQLPFIDNLLVTGKLGQDVNLAKGQEAARACGLMVLAQVKNALGDLSRVSRIIKLSVFIAAASDFTDLPKVANGASDLMVSVFGEAGKHSRAAVGVPVLPLDAAVEVEAIFEVA